MKRFIANNQVILVSNILFLYSFKFPIRGIKVTIDE